MLERRKVLVLCLISKEERNYQDDAPSTGPELNPPAVASEQFEILISSLTINNWYAIADQFPGVLAIDVCS